MSRTSLSRAERGPDRSIDLRLGRWQEALADVESCDSVICDPPYSERTHQGQRSNRGAVVLTETSVGYGSVCRSDIDAAVAFFAAKVRRWFVVFGDHVSAEQWRISLEEAGLYAFSPVIWTKTDAAPRFDCSGPSPQHETITIARPRRKLSRVEMRYRPGWYSGPSDNKWFRTPAFHIIGQKPLWIMTTLVAAYSEPGDLVVDPFAGSGTTAIACHRMGRACVTCEQDPDTYAVARARIDRELAQGDLFNGLQL